MTSEMFVVVVEPKKAPYLQATNNPQEIIRDKVGMSRDLVQIDPDAVMVIDDDACLSPANLEEIGKKLTYNFSWLSLIVGSTSYDLDFSGAVVIVTPDGDGFEQHRAEEIKQALEKVTGRSENP